MQRRAERTRHVILKAAAETFEARGYLGTSLQNIVTGRHVSKGALYFHFPSKEDLALAILADQHELWPALISELRRRQQSAIRILLELFCQATAILRDDALARASTRLACELDLIDSSAPRLFAGWADVVEELLHEAREQGDLLPEADSRVVAEVVVAAFAGLQRMNAINPAKTDLQELVTAMWRHMLPGLVTAERLPEIMEHLGALSGDA
ncbi:ScbR family autoregulator-binding transcription factor [Actinomadura sp. DC4]|uniref:ScbR family autoregulator-binding transcription factor n=1 Tax=Actinomadura sp. DC4 TaxID=3055069 RepID=UPI0025AF0714|nr:ScbR family autoregulator-binding transcription factor [Actinomadura sp. DC4]MDN3351818.1 ScbR family autoregulator-binding transcription factor [Actinomadura sp. DC4]